MPTEKKKKFIKGELADKMLKEDKKSSKKNRTGKEIRSAMYKAKED